jgi:hypothetical protein
MYSWLPGSTQYFSTASQMSLKQLVAVMFNQSIFSSLSPFGLISKCVVYTVVSSNAPAIHASTSERR